MAIIVRTNHAGTMQRKRQGSKSLSLTHRGMTTLPTHAFRLHCPHGYRRPPLVALAHGAARGRHDGDPARARHAARVVARAKPSALEARDRSRGRVAAGITADGAGLLSAHHVRAARRDRPSVVRSHRRHSHVQLRGSLDWFGDLFAAVCRAALAERLRRGESRGIGGGGDAARLAARPFRERGAAAGATRFRHGGRAGFHAHGRGVRRGADDRRQHSGQDTSVVDRGIRPRGVAALRRGPSARGRAAGLFLQRLNDHVRTHACATARRRPLISLLRCRAGLEPHCEGTVRLGPDHWLDTARGVFVPPHRRGGGVVFQDSRLFSHLDVRGNLRYGHRRTRTERRSTFDDVVQCLDLAVLLPRLPHSLSGGERQRVALGRALLAQPRVLLLDEPLAALDRRRKRDMLPYLARLRAELAIPMLYVSHHVDELIECDDLLVLEQGRLVATGPLPDLLARLDLTLAQDDDAGALIAATVVAPAPAYHVTQLALGTQRLIVGSQSVEIGTRLRLRVHARDVAIGLEPPRRSSLLNIIAACIVEIAQTAQAGHVLVKLEIEGQTLLARITRKSAEGLALRAGMPVYALIKSVALMR